jgi:hypothetical protein
MAELTVRNPVARLTAAVEPTTDPSGTPDSSRAPRMALDAGARIGLWWNLKVGGDVALEWLADNLSSRYGTTTDRFYGRYPGAPELVAAAAAQSSGVIGATGD